MLFALPNDSAVGTYNAFQKFVSTFRQNRNLVGALLMNKMAAVSHWFPQTEFR
jgi:hypothetical protein